MSNNISQLTDDVVKLILQFIADYHKYYGKIFVYDGTVYSDSLFNQDYLEVSRREAREIATIVDVIQREEDKD